MGSDIRYKCHVLRDVHKVGKGFKACSGWSVSRKNIYAKKNMKKPYNLEELDRRDLVCVWHKGEFHPPEYLDTL